MKCDAKWHSEYNKKRYIQIKENIKQEKFKEMYGRYGSPQEIKQFFISKIKYGREK